MCDNTYAISVVGDFIIIETKNAAGETIKRESVNFRTADVEVDYVNENIAIMGSDEKQLPVIVNLYGSRTYTGITNFSESAGTVSVCGKTLAVSGEFLSIEKWFNTLYKARLPFGGDLADGDLIYWDATAQQYARLPIGSNTETLTVVANALAWA
jgi:hypothetical protein